MTIKTTALGIAAVCLVFGATPAWAGGATCGTVVTTPRLMCDEGACIRVPFKDLCDAVHASYPVKRRTMKPSRVELNPVREELTLLIARVS
jgi:hypothetical protein